MGAAGSFEFETIVNENLPNFHGESLGDVLDRYRNYLYLIARTQIDLHLAVRTSASDVVQETFLQAARDFAAFRGGETQQLVAWLRRILINKILDARDRHLAAKRDVRREQPLQALAREMDASSMQIELALARSVDAPDARLNRQETAAQVADLLAGLTADHREVIILRNLEALPFSEIGERMGRSSAAVRKLWARAIQELKLPNNGST